MNDNPVTSPSHDQTQQGPGYFDRFSKAHDINNDELPFSIVKLTRKEPGANRKQESRKDLERTLENLTKTFLDKREGKRNLKVQPTKPPPFQMLSIKTPMALS